MTEPSVSARPPSGLLQVGDLVDHTYRICGELGSGSMGVVYKAHDERLDRDVALKVMHPAHFDEDGMYEQFEAEARALARVRHPNVVEVFALGYLGQAPYFVMEYVDGPDLGRWRARASGPLSIDEALGVLDPLCRGVQAVHEAGAVHRDIKPSNILVGPAFRIAIADLGLARPIADVPAAGKQRGNSRMVAGTPAYMAPELVLERELDADLAPRADVYALGVVAFELLTGEWPIPGRGAAELLQAQVYEPPRRVTALRRDLSPAFDEVLGRALEKDPEQRYKSADAFRRALHHARRTASPIGKVLRVLVVDDDDEQRELLSLWLERDTLDIRVEHADNGQSALELLQRNAPPDLAIVDLHMPQMGGAELVAAMRDDPRTRDLPVIVVTGLGGAPDWKELQRLGASGFMVKPIDAAQLLSLIRRIAIMRRRR